MGKCKNNNVERYMNLVNEMSGNGENQGGNEMDQFRRGGSLPKAEDGWFDKVKNVVNTIINPFGTLVNYGVDKVKENVANNWNASRGYAGVGNENVAIPNVLERIWNTGFKNESELASKNIVEEGALEQNMFRMYLGQPQNEDDFQFQKSQYVPTKGHEEGDEYWSIPEEYRESIYGTKSFPQEINLGGWHPDDGDLMDYLKQQYSGVVEGDMVVGDYTRGVGRDDDNNIYLSAYDKFDLNPFNTHQPTGRKSKIADMLSGFDDLSFGIGDPQSIYDRFGYTHVNSENYPEFYSERDRGDVYRNDVLNNRLARKEMDLNWDHGTNTWKDPEYIPKYATDITPRNKDTGRRAHPISNLVSQKQYGGGLPTYGDGSGIVSTLQDTATEVSDVYNIITNPSYSNDRLSLEGNINPDIGVSWNPEGNLTQWGSPIVNMGLSGGVGGSYKLNDRLTFDASANYETGNKPSYSAGLTYNFKQGGSLPRFQGDVGDSETKSKATVFLGDDDYAGENMFEEDFKRMEADLIKKYGVGNYQVIRATDIQNEMNKVVNSGKEPINFSIGEYNRLLKLRDNRSDIIEEEAYQIFKRNNPDSRLSKYDTAKELMATGDDYNDYVMEGHYSDIFDDAEYMQLSDNFSDYSANKRGFDKQKTAFSSLSSEDKLKYYKTYFENMGEGSDVYMLKHGDNMFLSKAGTLSEGTRSDFGYGNTPNKIDTFAEALNAWGPATMGTCYMGVCNGTPGAAHITNETGMTTKAQKGNWAGYYNRSGTYGDDQTFDEQFFNPQNKGNQQSGGWYATYTKDGDRVNVDYTGYMTPTYSTMNSLSPMEQNQQNIDNYYRQHKFGGSLPKAQYSISDNPFTNLMTGKGQEYIANKALTTVGNYAGSNVVGRGVSSVLSNPYLLPLAATVEGFNFMGTDLGETIVNEQKTIDNIIDDNDGSQSLKTWGIGSKYKQGGSLPKAQPGTELSMCSNGEWNGQSVKTGCGYRDSAHNLYGSAGMTFGSMSKDNLSGSVRGGLGYSTHIPYSPITGHLGLSGGTRFKGDERSMMFNPIFDATGSVGIEGEFGGNSYNWREPWNYGAGIYGRHDLIGGTGTTAGVYGNIGLFSGKFGYNPNTGFESTLGFGIPIREDGGEVVKHTIVKGDNGKRLEAMYGTKFKDILKHNDLTYFKLGAEIEIPKYQSKGAWDGQWWDDFKKSDVGGFVDAKGFERMFGMDQGIGGTIGKYFGYDSDEGVDLALDATAILNPTADFIHAATKFDEGEYTDAALYGLFGILPFTAGPLVRGTKNKIINPIKNFFNEGATRLAGETATHTYNPISKQWVEKSANKVQSKLLVNDINEIATRDYFQNKVIRLEQGKIKIANDIAKWEKLNPGVKLPEDLIKMDKIVNSQLTGYNKQLEKVLKEGSGNMMDKKLLKQLNLAEKLDMERVVGDYKWDDRNMFSKYFNTSSPPN